MLLHNFFFLISITFLGKLLFALKIIYKSKSKKKNDDEHGHQFKYSYPEHISSVTP